MKRTLSMLLILFVALASTFALEDVSFTGHLGLLSGVGVSAKHQNFELGASVQTAFPYAAILKLKNQTPIEKEDFFAVSGIDAYGLYNVISTAQHTVGVGIDLFYGNYLLPNILFGNFAAKYTYHFNRQHGAFASVGIPMVLAVPGEGAMFIPKEIGSDVEELASMSFGFCKIGYSYTF